MNTITPCLWFNNNAGDALQFYKSIFKSAKILSTHYQGKKLLFAEFRLNGQDFMALNGGPQFKFNEAVSLEINCDTQDEIDYYWERLSAGGDPKAQACGWLKDRYGLSWQVVPTVMPMMMADHESAAARRVMAALLEMKKLDIEALQRAFAG